MWKGFKVFNNFVSVLKEKCVNKEINISIRLLCFSIIAMLQPLLDHLWSQLKKIETNDHVTHDHLVLFFRKDSALWFWLTLLLSAPIGLLREGGGQLWVVLNLSHLLRGRASFQLESKGKSQQYCTGSLDLCRCGTCQQITRLTNYLTAKTATINSSFSWPFF